MIKTYCKLQWRVQFNHLLRITERHHLKILNRGNMHVNYVMKTKNWMNSVKLMRLKIRTILII